MHLDVRHVLRVTPIAPSQMVLPTRTPIQIDQAIVIACRNQGLLFIPLHDIDMATISASREDAIDVPAKFDGMAHPVHVFGVRGATRVLLFYLHVEEQKFISTAARPNLLTIYRPVKTCDEA